MRDLQRGSTSLQIALERGLLLGPLAVEDVLVAQVIPQLESQLIPTERGPPGTVHLFQLIHPLKAEQHEVLPFQPAVQSSGLQAYLVLALHPLAALLEDHVRIHLHAQVTFVEFRARDDLPRTGETRHPLLLDAPCTQALL